MSTGGSYLEVPGLTLFSGIFYLYLLVLGPSISFGLAFLILQSWDMCPILEWHWAHMDLPEYSS